MKKPSIVLGKAWYNNFNYVYEIPEKEINVTINKKKI